jgi:AAT family amino acid transporter
VLRSQLHRSRTALDLVAKVSPSPPPTKKTTRKYATALTVETSIVGVSNQISWVCIGIASLRFRAAIRHQNLEHLLPFKNWTYPVGPIIAVGLNIVLILVQGWSCFSPSFQAVDFVSFYIEIPVMIVMFLAWKLVKRTRFVHLDEMDLVTDRYDLNAGHDESNGDGDGAESPSRVGRILHIKQVETEKGVLGKLKRVGMWLFL